LGPMERAHSFAKRNLPTASTPREKAGRREGESP
jgi:hypothetical protein